MKKVFLGILSACVIASSYIAVKGESKIAFAEQTFKINSDCKSAYLCDYESGECIYKYNENERLPIASVCKVMTLNLCFEAISDGRLNINDTITVSKTAESMGGSQVYLQSGLAYPVTELIKSIVVCSANDSCVAISEAICGSEEQFVALMNSRAEEYGCTNTLFANCTGLPKETQYSCAKDVAVMFSHLIGNDEYFKYSKIWLEDFAHPDGRTTTITNTNRLVKSYSACDGGKTGFTNQAGFCLASTSKKDNLRLVSVVLGSSSSKDRFKSAINMFEYGFANYKNAIVLDKEVNLSDKVAVNGGKKAEISVKPARPCYVFSKKDQSPDVKFIFTPIKVSAPVSKGDSVGKIEVYKDGILYDTVDVVASEECPKANFGDIIKKVADGWGI